VAAGQSSTPTIGCFWGELIRRGGYSEGMVRQIAALLASAGQSRDQLLTGEHLAMIRWTTGRCV
jgi:hypothetical protein